MTSTYDILFSGPFGRTMLTNFFFFGSLNGYVLLPLYVHQLGGNEGVIGVVQGMYSAAGILCQPLVGACIDRVGRHFFMVLGTTLLTLSCAVFVVTTSIPVLGALRALQGVGFSAFFVANYIHVVELVPLERRGWALGIYGLSGLLSTSLAPLAGEFLIRRLGYPWFFAWTALLAGSALALVARMRDVRPPSMTGGPDLQSLREAVQELLHLHMALAFCFGLGTGTIFTFLPTFAVKLGVTGLGLFYTAYAGAAMLVRLTGGELIDTRGRRAVIIPAMFIQAGATCILALVAILVAPSGAAPVLPFLFLAGFMAGGAHGFLYPALSALLMDVTPERRRGSAVGTFSSVVLVGNAMGAMVFGYVAHGLGYRVMWSALTLLLLSGFALSFRLRVGYLVKPLPAAS
ncbi:MAG TPA: MFS transporter [Candidatus Methylomirabilis sp.]|nr:MFS transporter [Candidatus Methylomirabilis sp.]